MDPFIFTGLPDSKKREAVNNIKQTDPEVIITAVCEALEVSRTDLVGPRRFDDLSQARHIAIRLMMLANPRLTLKQVGRIFSRHHSTVINSITVYDELMETSKEFRQKVALVKPKI
jgi:chromosomal replication initiation ATPase DnaA